ncbi:hypothetical protein BSL78_24714 [Apostichopus japonicus]|uniref:Immunoglobulin domain-containing protein n=1 Tax=Stichopus japonicus TaxID=307972 RepID=A0A2G8JRZ0_STIJA|nr:hypothetical protein BSL78_24714 [Apostichopus japonicus]
MLGRLSSPYSFTSSSRQRSCDMPVPQYAELGGSATIQCDFDIVNTYNVYWYRSVQDTTPFIRYDRGTVPPISGSGFDTASYSVSGKGSLIIFDVETDNERTYKVLAYNRNDDKSETLFVDVHTHAKCEQAFPLINYCKNQSTCLVDSDSIKGLGCSFGCSIPAAELRLYIKRGDHEETIAVNDKEESDGTQVDLTSKGIYRCKFFDGEKFGAYEQSVTVLVSPSPPFLLVDGCPQTTQPCSVNIMVTTSYHNVTCYVNEVYPKLSLSLENEFADEMAIWNFSSLTVARNDRYTISASAELQLLDPFSCNDEHFIICRALGVGAFAMVNSEKKIKISWGKKRKIFRNRLTAVMVSEFRKGHGGVRRTVLTGHNHRDNGYQP